MVDLPKAQKVAEEAARDAGRAILGHYRKEYTVTDKGGDSPVTCADLEANGILKDRLGSAFPGFGWLSEESADSPLRLGCRTLWVVDPLDGTRDFILGTDEFAVSVGLVHDGRPVLGVVYVPPLNLVYTAAAGGGAFLNGSRIQHSFTRSISALRLIVSRSESRRDGLDAVLQELTLNHVVYAGSAALKLARVASGAVDAYVTLTPKNEWDFCAGEAILEEAGGTVTDGLGTGFHYNRRETRVPHLTASNGLVHADLLRMFRSHLSPLPGS